MSKKKSADLNLKALGPLARKAGQGALRYAAIMFFVLVAAVYGFVLLQINTLGNAQPSDSDISAQSKSTAIPNIDPKVIQQIQALQDNSTNVQTLFEQARDSPFQEGH
jgi:hypothetical protein